MSLFKTPALLALGGTLVLAGCDPTLEDRTKTRQGAAIGAATGALIGAAVGDGNRRDEILAGAVAGGLVGAGIGQQLDRQAQELRNQLDDRIQVTNTGDRLIVTMPQDILFDVDSASLRPDLTSDLRALAGNLRQYPDQTVQVIGHTDNTGDAAYNQDLSERRARSVAGVLLDAGVNASRVVPIGQGESQPIASNLTPEGRRQNRRVEIVIIPNA